LEFHTVILEREGDVSQKMKAPNIHKLSLPHYAYFLPRINRMRMRVIGILAVLGLAAIALPAPRIWADTDTVQAKTSSPLPALIDRALPSNLSPSLANAKSDRPKPYADRCHTQQDLSKSESNCEYGYLKSKTTIVLFGDSHALSWFPAIEKLAIAKKWKLLSLTMSSCWPSDIPAWNSTTNKLMDNCELWRMETLSDIVALKPAMIFVSGTRGFSTVDTKTEFCLAMPEPRRGRKE